jgi:hypothetical protein
VDAELAADFDRLSSGQGAGPTPAVLGIDILGQGPTARSGSVGIVGADAHFDLAAETQLTYHVDGRTESPVPGGLHGRGKPTGRRQSRHEFAARRRRPRLAAMELDWEPSTHRCRRFSSSRNPSRRQASSTGIAASPTAAAVRSLPGC